MSININIESSWQTPLVGTNGTSNVQVSGITEPSNLRGNDITQAQTSASNEEETQTPAPTAQHSSQNEEHDHDEENHLLFSCQCDSAGTVGTLLACLRRVLSKSSGGTAGIAATQGWGATQGGSSTAATSKLQHATVYAGPNGLTFHCVQGLAKQSQCSVDLPKGLFREYFVGEEEVWLEESDDESESAVDNGNGAGGSQKTVKAKETIQGGEFGINLTTVLECFSVLSKNHKPKASNSNGSMGEFASLNKVPLCMSYDRDTATFHLEFLDEAAGPGGCLVTCEVPGVAVDENGDQSGLASAFRSSPLLGRAILYSDALSAAVGELHDVPGASVVEVKLSKTGIELGTVGPRSEVWVNVPYHSRQGTAGMYVGLECYSEHNDMLRKYPLSAFLTGMRGLDIGCETCISVNSRGMMAIQHQISRDDTASAVRPSFVDFIMTCIEDEIEEEEHDADDSVRGYGSHSIRDVTNDASVQDEVSIRDKSLTSKQSRKKQHLQRATTRERDDASQSSDDDQNAVSFRGDDNTEQEKNTIETNTPSTDTSRILGELEVDNDMMRSNAGRENKRRQSALADIRRRRELKRQSMNNIDRSAETPDNANGRKRHSSASHAGSDESNTDDDEVTHSSRKQKILNDTPQDPCDSSSASDSSESEHEESQDVTDIPQIFSKSSSMRTSRHGSRRSRDGVTAESGSEDEAEPRMMYGDTKLEFTQDGYGSDDSM
eukprot:scaffold18805_cov95-Cyclotella_meneghiniana.AAC.10